MNNQYKVSKVNKEFFDTVSSNFGGVWIFILFFHFKRGQHGKKTTDA